MSAPAATPLPVTQINTDFQALIRAEQVRMLYHQLPTSTAGNMTGAVLLVGVFAGVQPLWTLTTWFTAMVILQAWRLALYFVTMRRNFLFENVDRAAVVWAIGTALAGILWGATAFLFFTSGQEIYQAVLTIVVFAIAAAAVPLIGSYMPSFYAFVFPALTPFIVRNAYEGDTLHYILSGVACAVVLGLLQLARNYNRMLIESLRNRFEKQGLAERLAAQNVALEQARVTAEQANRAKTQFFAAASHDLRQPLHAMGLFASALKHKVHDPEVAGIITSINASVQALEALFNELLDISKLDSGAIKLNLTNFNLAATFDRMRSEFSTEASAKNLRLSIDSGEHAVFSDTLLLERILRNLISNAIRYTREGEISVTAQPMGDMLKIEVRDTGIGIPEADQKRIFEEFIQLSNPARTSKKGLGLGLSIVQRLCGLLGYSIHLSSVNGEGSSFSFDVPLGQISDTPRSITDTQQAMQSDLREKLIVVIDDEAAIVEGMQVLLSSWGATVLGSTSGDDIISRVHDAGRMPDLIIVDYRLAEDGNGIDVAQRIRQELDPEIPALLITGSITPDLPALANTANLGFLLKPVIPHELRTRINSILNVNALADKEQPVSG